ncbi:unnamed protein product [Lactuca saligna]|uniref:Uncharacterized protein n=1 Tax=Lactuca saligna TaxID=75948 RepID=A0AA36E8N0_LACSI|nr:unnamed protein product [Lactuca saligna]
MAESLRCPSNHEQFHLATRTLASALLTKFTIQKWMKFCLDVINQSWSPKYHGAPYLVHEDSLCGMVEKNYAPDEQKKSRPKKCFIVSNVQNNNLKPLKTPHSLRTIFSLATFYLDSRINEAVLLRFQMVLYPLTSIAWERKNYWFSDRHDLMIHTVSSFQVLTRKQKITDVPNENIAMEYEARIRRRRRFSKQGEKKYAIFFLFSEVHVTYACTQLLVLCNLV